MAVLVFDLEPLIPTGVRKAVLMADMSAIPEKIGLRHASRPAF